MKRYSLEELKLINNIEFTNREIDILACVFNGRSPKVVGSLLSISTRTVETHLYNVMTKIACTSRQSIINFIENSPKADVFRHHYYTLLARSRFDKVLKEIKPAIIPKNLRCELNFYENKKLEPNTNLFNLIKDIRSIGVCVNIQKKDDGNPDLISITISNQDKNIGDILSKKTFKKEDLETDYYLTFFSIIKKILPTYSFEKDTQVFSNVPTQKKGEMPHENQKPKSRAKSLDFLFRFSPKILTSIILFSFAILFVNKIFSPTFLQSNVTNVSSELQVPSKTYILERYNILAEMANKLKNQEGIKTIALVGIGGSGKTTLARQYALSQKHPIIFEIDASTRKNTISSFKDLAYSLAQTDEQNSELEIIQRIKDQGDKEKKILIFVKKRLKELTNWLLLFDNLEALSDIQEYFPVDSNIWGNGSVIITTQNANIISTSYINSDNIIFINELSSSEVLCLFNKILASTNYPENRRREKLDILLSAIPPFPLDVSVAAYYIKNTQISYEAYLHRVKDSELIHNNILKEVSNHKKIRHELVINSIKKILEINPEFLELLTFIFLLDSQNIPLDLLEKFKNPAIVHQLLYHLKKYSLVNDTFLGASQPLRYFSIHRSTQKIGASYVLNMLKNNRNDALIQSIFSILKEYAYKILDENNFQKIKNFLPHWEIILAHGNLLKNDVKAECDFILGDLYLHLNNYMRAKEIFEESLCHLNNTYPKNYRLSAVTAAQLGNTYKFLGDYKKAMHYLEESLSIYKQHEKKNKVEYAKILVSLGKTCRISGYYEKAKYYTEKALSIYEEFFPNNHKAIASTLTSLGSIYRFQGDYKTAQFCLERSINLYKTHLKDNQIGLAWALAQLGVINSVRAQYKQAKLDLEKSVEIYKKFPEVKRELGHALTFLGYVNKRLGNWKTAEDLFKKSLAIFNTYFSGNYPESVWTLTQLGIMQRNLGNYKNAEYLLEKSLKIFSENYSSTHGERGWVLAHLGIVARELGQYKKAEALLKECHSIYLASLPHTHGNIAWVLTELGITYMYLGNNVKAIATIDHAQKIYKQAFEENNLKTSWSSVQLARVHINTGNYTQARELLNKSFKIHQDYFSSAHPRTLKILSLLSTLDKKIKEQSYTATPLSDVATWVSHSLLYSPVFTKSACLPSWIICP